ncbi:MAG: hypothetical protein AB1553_16315 [Nitrospirota bacterium]
MKQLLVMALLTLVLSGCNPAFVDVRNEVISSEIVLPENEHAYSATWLSSSIIIFLKYLNIADFDPEYYYDPNTIVVNEEMYAYNVDTQEWIKLNPDPMPKCHAQDIQSLQRLPNGKLGLVQSCRGPIFLDILQEFDISSQTMQVLFRNNVSPYVTLRGIGPYAHSPDMTEWVQEYPIGMYLNNQLFYIKLGEKPQRIVPDFLRAMTPAWSPHNREVAFWGTANYHGDNDPEINYTWDLVGIASYPWDLYMSSPQGDNVHLVLSSIENPGDIAWSPTRNVIAFSGTLKGMDGLWFLDPVTSEVTRIWNERVGFDWSPDGKRIVATYVDYSDDVEIKDVRAYLIQVPEAHSK